MSISDCARSFKALLILYSFTNFINVFPVCFLKYLQKEGVVIKTSLCQINQNVDVEIH